MSTSAENHLQFIQAHLDCIAEEIAMLIRQVQEGQTPRRSKVVYQDDERKVLRFPGQEPAA